MIPVERSHLYLAAKSHPGMSGKNNEDRYSVTAYKVSDKDTTPVVFAVVADGIGGHSAGEIAAEIAVETISEDVAHSDASHPLQTMREGIIHASNSILAASESDGDKKGMGATCACVWVIGNRLFSATVGDSRIYLLRGSEIKQISTDHTWVQEAINAGMLSPEEARVHPNAHVIRRYLGSRQTVEPDTRLKLNPSESDSQSETNQGMQLQPNDQILICSDGLTDLVNDNEIQKALQSDNLDKAVDSLIALANQRGGHDNITIVVLGVPEVVSQTKPLPEPKKSLRQKRSLRLPCLIIVVSALLLGTILLGGSYYYLRYVRSDPTPTLANPIEATESPLNSPAPTEAFSTLPASESTGAAAPENDSQGPGIPTSTYTPWPTDTPIP